MAKECGNKDCAMSTGVHEGLTFGRGDIDFNGYWDIPCAICARAWEKKHPDDAPCWPFEPELHTSADTVDLEKVRGANLRGHIGPDDDEY